MSGGDEFTVDSIKTYEVSQVKDVSKHETPVEKLVYLEQIDSLVCLSRGSRSFRLYEPKRCALQHQVSGHRGTVINCCYVDAWAQIATTAADMTICFWDSHLQLRNRLAAKDVQLCLQWDTVSRSLFSGAIDGTLSRWDLNNMTLADLRKGNHKKAINDLLMVHDINLLASASSDGSILMWDTAMMKPKKTFKGHKKGTFSLAYSMDYHCLLTAGLDQEALARAQTWPLLLWMTPEILIEGVAGAPAAMPHMKRAVSPERVYSPAASVASKTTKVEVACTGEKVAGAVKFNRRLMKIAGLGLFAIVFIFAT
ncbi:unnamed protein product [Effrenium voratum]|nr:unnamed protein product [Effrenium voratum]